MAESKGSVEDRVSVRVELSRGEYEALKAIARREGYSLVSDYLRAVVRDLIEGKIGKPAPSGGEQVDVIARRLERTLVDILNPYTGKIDEILRRLSDVVELLERGEERARLPAREAREARRAPATAMGKLKEQGVVFQEDVQWMKSPEKFFEKLKKEGAVVIEVGGEKIAVDPDFWSTFEEELEKISVSSVDEAADLLEASLGEAAGKLFRKIARQGIAVYDEDEGVWVIRFKSQP